jgi:hypothetical protein
MLRYLSNNAHGIIAAELDARGEGATFGGPVAGAEALRAAIRALGAGAIDRALVVAYDTLLTPELLVELGERGATRSEGPAGPYRVTSDGFVPGEAAAALMIERDAVDALARIDVRCVIGPARGEPDAGELARAAAPLASRGAIVDGSGRGDLEADRAERIAVAALVGDDAPLTATSAAMGRVGAATPLVQLIALASCLRRRTVPPMAGVGAFAAGPLSPVDEPRRAGVSTALALSSGMPGAASAIRVEVSP